MICYRCSSDGGQYPFKHYYVTQEYLCKNCHPSYPIDHFNPSYLHQKVSWADPKIDRNYTVAKDKVLINQIISRDDGKTIVDRRYPNKEAPY